MVRDMTKGSVLKAITLFAIPLFIGAVFQQIYNAVDTIVVGRYVSAFALGAVGSCAGTFNLIIALMTGLSGGAGVLLAQHFGAKDEEMVKKTFINTIIVMLVVGIILTIIGTLCARPLLILLKTPEEQMEYAVSYLTVMCLGILANCLYNGISAVLRALGDSVTPLIALIIASLLNVGMDILFVVVFGWGVVGVAVATVLAQLISAIFCIVYMFIRLPMLRFRIKDIVIETELIIDIAKIGVSTALSSVGVSLSVMFMQRAINSCGPAVVSGYTVANKAENICMCLAFSIGMSVGMFCGQNIGAKEYDRVKKGYRIGCLVAFLYGAIVAVFVIAFAGPLAAVFSTDPEVVDVAKEVIYVTMGFGPVLGLVFVYQNFLRSAGDIAPTVIMSVMEMVARSVLALVFVRIWGRMGIWWVTPIGWTACMIFGFIRYQSGAWKKKILVK